VDPYKIIVALHLNGAMESWVEYVKYRLLVMYDDGVRTVCLDYIGYVPGKRENL